jgi:hypothetical protein
VRAERTDAEEEDKKCWSDKPGEHSEGLCANIASAQARSKEERRKKEG